MLDSKKNLKTIDLLVIAVSTLVVYLLTLFFVSKILKNRLDLPFNRKSIEESNLENFTLNIDRIDTLILGDSHPGQSLINLLPTNWLKATHPGEDLESSLLKFKYFVNKSKKIKYLIIPLDYHSLNGSWGVPKQEYDVYRENFMTELFKVNKLFDDYNRKIAVNWAFSKLNDKVFKLNLPQNKPATGWEQIREGDRDLLKKIKVRADGMLHYPIIDKRSVTHMDQIFEISKKNNIRLIGVRYPLPNDFIRYVNKNGLNKMDKWIIDNRKMFYKILDFRDIFKINQEYFGNEDHLNIEGGNKFTTQFVNNLIKIEPDIESGNSLVKLPTSYPKNYPVIDIVNSNKLHLVNIESPYGAEQDKTNSWFWLGSKRKLGLIISLISIEEITKTISINHSTSRDCKLLYNNIRVFSEPELIHFKEGFNSIYLSPVCHDKSINNTLVDQRDLSIKIESIIIK